MPASFATFASPFAPQAPARRAALGLLALFVLNALLSMTNWWPTPFVKFDARLAPEFVVFWVLLLAIAWRGSARTPSTPLLKPHVLSALAGVYMLLVLGRYLDSWPVPLLKTVLARAPLPWHQRRSWPAGCAAPRRSAVTGVAQSGGYGI